MVSINNYNPHKQDLFGILKNLKMCEGILRPKQIENFCKVCNPVWSWRSPVLQKLLVSYPPTPRPRSEPTVNEDLQVISPIH